MEDRFDINDLFYTKSYNVGDDVVTIEQTAIYIGSGSSISDEDWINIARVFVNREEVFDIRAFNYGPQRITDEQALKKTIEYPNDIHAKHAIEEYEKYSFAIQNMSVLERFFNRKTYLKLIKGLRSIEKKYNKVSKITSSISLLRSVADIADKTVQNPVPTEQPSSL